MTNANTFKAARLLYYVACLTLCQLTIRPAISITLSDWLFLGSLIALLVEIFIFNKKIELRLPSLFVFSCMMVVAGGLLSLLHLNDKVTSLSVVLRFIYLTIVWFWLGTMVLRTEYHVQRAIVLWLLSLAVSGIAASLQLVDPLIIPGADSFKGRMVGFTGHPNDLGSMSAVGWGVIFTWLIRDKLTLNTSIIKCLIAIAILAGLVLSGSTGSAIAAIVSTVICLALINNVKRSVLISITLVSLFIPILAFQHITGGESIFHRLDQSIYSTKRDSTLITRIHTYNAALEEIILNPIIGSGFQPGGTKTKNGMIVHNAYLAILYEAGLLGFIGMITLTISSAVLIKYLLLKTRGLELERHLVIALSASAIAFFVYSLSAPVLYQRYGWISISFLFSLRAIIQRKMRYDSAKHSVADN